MFRLNTLFFFASALVCSLPYVAAAQQPGAGGFTGKRNIRAVNVNAISGAVIGVNEESPATEKKEARANSAKKRTP